MASDTEEILEGRVDRKTGQFVCEEPCSKNPGFLCLSTMKNADHNKRSHRSKFHAASGRHASLSQEMKIDCVHCKKTYSSPHNLVAHYRENPKTHEYRTKQEDVFKEYPELAHRKSACIF